MALSVKEHTVSAVLMEAPGHMTSLLCSTAPSKTQLRLAKAREFIKSICKDIFKIICTAVITYVKHQKVNC